MSLKGAWPGSHGHILWPPVISLELLKQGCSNFLHITISPGLANYPLVDVFRITRPIFNFGAQVISLEYANFKYGLQIDIGEYYCRQYRPHQRKCAHGHSTSVNFGKLLILCRKRHKIQTWSQWKANRKLYVAYRMAPISLLP